MKPSHLLWIAPLVGAVALYVVEQRRHDAALAELRGDLAALSARGPAPRATPELGRPVARVTPSPAAASAAAAEPAATPAATAAPSPPLEPDDIRDRLEVSFTQQRPDARADEARRRAESRLAAMLSEKTKLRSLECRSGMCRIETAHQGAESYQQFVRGAFLNADTKLWNGGFFATPLVEAGGGGGGGDGEIVIVSYLAHEGEELPPLPGVGTASPPS